ncbi:MAG: hypothetical protein A2498_10910 [Lentisphaerae bacterium RIFOXYC12_FULL_60_16]|nr:MAG: hypothetical protein A2498_10910 [Lentisphaerae bacterium RIFOXYC12_FULL_60_16]
MYRIGQPEIDAVARVLKSKRMFRYGVTGGECIRFEERYSAYLGVKHCLMTASGTNALTAALIGLGIGPGDEVLVPACTYMASAIAVIAAGAIPVVVDIDESVTLSPEAVTDAIGPRTRAVMPVHMWGLPCDMNRIMRVVRRRKLLVVEDACQAVGGGYRGRKLGSFGDAAAFSFNFFKNMTAGEGGCAITRTEAAMKRMRCVVDPCSFYWTGRTEMQSSFLANGARASEIEGAILNVQLDRIDGMLAIMRRQKSAIRKAGEKAGLTMSPMHSPDDECGTHNFFLLPTAAKAEAFAAAVGGTVARKTGRHVYTEWVQIFAHQGAHHPALNPFRLPANKGCRMHYTPDMCRQSLDILDRTVFTANHPDLKAVDLAKRIKTIRDAAAIMT